VGELETISENRRQAKAEKLSKKKKKRRLLRKSGKMGLGRHGKKLAPKSGDW